MMKTKAIMMSCMVTVGAILASCSSSEVDEQPKANFGSICLSVKPNASFTRAVNESDYANTENYTVEILSSDGTSVYSELYKDVSNTINLQNGNYTLKAYYGKEEVASRNTFYVLGQTNFIVSANDQDIEVNCQPTCGKVKTFFDKSMADYFSSYSVVYETKALAETNATVAWAAADTEPWYLKIAEEGEAVKATISLTRSSDGKSSTIVKEYAMTPGKSWTLNIAPKSDNGTLGITITIDETVEDIPTDIVVPSDWI